MAKKTVALILFQSGQLSDATELVTKARHIQETIPRNSLECASMLNKMARILHARGAKDDALTHVCGYASIKQTTARVAQ